MADALFRAAVPSRRSPGALSMTQVAALPDGNTLLPALGALLEAVKQRCPKDAIVEEKCTEVLLAAGKDMERSLMANAAMQRVAQLEQRVVELKARATHLPRPSPATRIARPHTHH